jgi:DNA repair protein RecN (Recombination protein N)
MLATLRVQNFAIVDALEVRFGPGLNVITGETGAGKSILVDALGLVLGDRASPEVVREGAEEGVVEALLELPADHPVFERLAALGLGAGEGGELLVRRVVSRSGRGRAFVNGSLCTVGMLQELMRGVVDVSGQHQHVSLLDPGCHRGLLDAFAGIDGEAGSLAAYRKAYAALVALAEERGRLQGADAERAERADFIEYQLKELEGAEPRPGEEGELAQEHRLLASAARRVAAAATAGGACYDGEGSASERIAQAVRALGDAAGLDPRLEGPLGLLRSAAIEVEEAGRELRRYASEAGSDPERLAAVEDRLELLRRLARKHGRSLESVIFRREAMKAELAELRRGGDRLSELGPELDRCAREAELLARGLSRSRKEAAKTFSPAVEAELGRLAMERCRFQVELTPCEPGSHGLPLGPDGAERVELLIAPNPGEPARPLARIASGGELSRVLLAVKRVLARRDTVAAYVFDEVDAGVGGAVAEATGRLLEEVAKNAQVICVTHLPQIAARGVRHHRVGKEVSRNRTAARIELLGDTARVEEIARMLAGATITDSARQHARALMAGPGTSQPHAKRAQKVARRARASA